MRATGCSFAVVVVFAAGAWGQAVADSTLVERVRAALGEPGPGVVTASGEARFLGVDGSYSIAFDGEGRFVSAIESELGLRGGYDGETAWEVDWNGTARVLELGDDDASLMQSWAVSGHWVRSGGVLELTELMAGPEGPAVGISMGGGRLEAVAYIDAETWLPERVVISRTQGDQTISLSGFAGHEGLMLPGLVELHAPDGEVTSIRLTGFGTAPGASFAPDLTPPDDVWFDGAAPAALEVRRVPTGHLLVHPTLNGEDVGWFIFDTGAGSNVLSTPVAERLGLEAVGRVTARGVGGTVESGFYRVGELTLGRVTLEGQAFVGIDLSFLRAHFGVEVAGIVGYGLLSRCVAEFDGVEPAISLFAGEGYGGPEGVHWEPLMLPARIPVTMGKVEGKPAAFRLDTGAAGDSVSFHAPAVRSMGLLEGRETRAATSGGVGGMVSMRAGAVRTFSLGGSVWENLPVLFATESVGVFADAYTAGNVGGVVLNRFEIVFDYPGRRIGFVERGE